MTGGLNGPPILNGLAYVYPTETLANLRDQLLCMLGFPDPLTTPDAQTETLVYLREAVIRRCGFYYVAGANPPGQDVLINGFINEAQQTIFRTVEFDKGGVSYPALMVADSDPTEIDYTPVFLLSLGLAKSHYQQADAKAYFEQFSKYLSDRAVRRPPKVVAMCSQWLTMAQKMLYRRYKLLRTELWWQINIEVGERIYDVPYDADSELDFRSASEVWLQDGQTWLPLFPGINPAAFTTTTQTMPTHFEFREFFEVFPEPQKSYTAWIKGHRGLLPFVADGDTSTIDYELILLQALVWGKQHFRQPDAREFKSDLEIWIGKLNAGTFAGIKIVPRGTRPELLALPYPQVTFTRI